MKSFVMVVMLSLTAIADVNAQKATPAPAIWAASPAGSQPMPDAPPLVLLQWSGAVPLKVSEGGKCLLVARRGQQIVAIELSPVTDGPKLLGWSPKKIDMNAATSRWGYVPPAWTSEQAKFSNPATASIADANKTIVNHSVAPTAQSSGEAWSNANVQAHNKAALESEAHESVTVNGKTYSKYSHFKAASAEKPVAVSDEYICQ